MNYFNRYFIRQKRFHLIRLRDESDATCHASLARHDKQRSDHISYQITKPNNIHFNLSSSTYFIPTWPICRLIVVASAHCQLHKLHGLSPIFSSRKKSQTTTNPYELLYLACRKAQYRIPPTFLALTQSGSGPNNTTWSEGNLPRLHAH